jgi:hypothetical protein
VHCRCVSTLKGCRFCQRMFQQKRAASFAIVYPTPISSPSNDGTLQVIIMNALDIYLFKSIHRNQNSILAMVSKCPTPVYTRTVHNFSHSVPPTPSHLQPPILIQLRPPIRMQPPLLHLRIMIIYHHPRNIQRTTPTPLRLLPLPLPQFRRR